MNQPKICVHCDKPVEKYSDDYEVFEQMHWLCFHLVFEHEGDPDVACNDPSCPWWHIEVLRNKLTELGVDPQSAITDAVNKKWKL
jgi:hypothetical protein